MNTNTYKKPEMKFVSVRNESAVAAKCWGHQSDKGANRKALYADIPGVGYCSFLIESGSCALNLTEVKYYQYNDDPGESASSDQIAALNKVLIAAGGNEGEPFAGEGTVVIPGRPEPEWS